MEERPPDVFSGGAGFGREQMVYEASGMLPSFHAVLENVAGLTCSTSQIFSSVSKRTRSNSTRF